jgi:hypothetical protein
MCGMWLERSERPYTIYCSLQPRSTLHCRYVPMKILLVQSRHYQIMWFVCQFIDYILLKIHSQLNSSAKRIYGNCSYLNVLILTSWPTIFKCLEKLVVAKKIYKLRVY